MTSLTFFAIFLILTREVDTKYNNIAGLEITTDQADELLSNIDPISERDFIVTTSGDQSGHPISNAFDYSSSTYWESSLSISNSSIPFIEFTFPSIQDIDFILYYPQFTSNYAGFSQTINVSASIGNSSYHLKYSVEIANLGRVILINFSRILWCDKLKLEFVETVGDFPNCQQLYLMKVVNPSYQHINIEAAGSIRPDHILYDDCISVNSSDDLNPSNSTRSLIDIFNWGNYFWYTSQPNTADFKNYISYQFRKIECLTGIRYGHSYITYSTNRTRDYVGFSYVMNIYARNVATQNFELTYVCAGFPPTVQSFHDESLFQFPESLCTDELKIEFEEVTFDRVFTHSHSPVARFIILNKQTEVSPTETEIVNFTSDFSNTNQPSSYAQSTESFIPDYSTTSYPHSFSVTTQPTEISTFSNSILPTDDFDQDSQSTDDQTKMKFIIILCTSIGLPIIVLCIAIFLCFLKKSKKKEEKFEYSISDKSEPNKNNPLVNPLIEPTIY